MKVPLSLVPSLRYYRRGVVFWLCVERARLAYYRGDNDALRGTCDTVNGAARCPDLVKQASISRALIDRDQLAKYGWHNCMNNAFHEGYGEYPIEAWRAFLEEFAIEETVITPP